MATAKTRPVEVAATKLLTEALDAGSLPGYPATNQNPAPEPKVERLMKVCGTCKHWRPQALDTTIGQCLPSAKALPAPLMTTDLTSCNKWELLGK